MSVYNLLEHFDPDEFDEPDKLSPLVLLRLDWARARADRPVYITSDFRPESPGSHGKGLAVDISDNLKSEEISSRWRYHTLEALLHVGFHRIGIYDKHVHVDADPERDPDVIWTGESQ